MPDQQPAHAADSGPVSAPPPANSGRNALIRMVTKRLFVVMACEVVLLGAVYAAMLAANSNVIPVAPVVLAMGMLGGFVSLQRRLKRLSKVDLKLLSRSRSYLALAPLAGGILAVILYCMFVGNLLQGEMFPAFKEGPEFAPGKWNPKTGLWRLFYCEAVGYAAYAKLVVWSFLAGFSERFVTDILGNLGSIDKADNRARRT